MKKLYVLLFTLLITSLSFGQVIITEIADPNNNSAAAATRYIEIFNPTASAVDLTNWELRRWTNGNNNFTVSTVISLTPLGNLGAGAFAVIAVNATTFQAVYGFAPDIDAGTGGPADSNGDDQMAIFDAGDTIIDIFGVPGEDGTGTCHEFEDGRAERKGSATTSKSTWDEADWNVWADSAVSGCTSHVLAAQDAPGDFDPGAWIGDTNLSSDKFEANSFKIYPNPTSLGFVNISSRNGETIKATVIDILGKQVINSTITNNKLDVSNLSPGLYIMQLTQNNATVTKKLVIQ